MTSVCHLAQPFVLTLLLCSLAAGTWAQETTGPAPTAPSTNVSVVNVTARGLTFDAPDTTRSGWTTFRLKNESEMIHFAVLERLPEDIGIEDHQKEVAPVFQKGMDLLKAGKPEAASKAFGGLPRWFGDRIETTSGERGFRSTAPSDPLDLGVQTTSIAVSIRPQGTDLVDFRP